MYLYLAIGLIKFTDLINSLSVSILCNNTQQFTKRVGIYFSTPWISAGSMTCFSQSNVAKVILCDFWAPTPKGLTASALIRLQSGCHHTKEKLMSSCQEGRNHVAENQTLQPKALPGDMWIRPDQDVNKSILGHPASIDMPDECNHEINP